VYASALGKPIRVPQGATTSLGSALFALLAAGAFASIDAAQDALCPAFRTVEPNPADVAVYEGLYNHFKSIYFSDQLRAALSLT